MRGEGQSVLLISYELHFMNAEFGEKKKQFSCLFSFASIRLNKSRIASLVIIMIGWNCNRKRSSRSIRAAAAAECILIYSG